MRVTLAKSAGFCYGVKRAVELAQAVAGEGCYLLGPVIHNDHVIEELEHLGAKCVQILEEVPDGATVVLRSHGEAQAIHRALEAKGCTIVDTACPNVTRIHQIVAQAQSQGRQCVIIGAHDHPEVTAIAGWCRDAVVLGSEAEVDQWLARASELGNTPITVVCQTTQTEKLWHLAKEKIKKVWTNAEFFDTICRATHIRQSEAQALARQSDVIVVIGDPKSSNTRRLAELCRELCPQVLAIEGPEALNRAELPGDARVGLTAGASTPGWIIKEVYNKMSDEIMEIEESFADLLEKSIKTLHNGEKVTGIVTAITPTDIQVDLGTKHAGYIPVGELTDDPTVKVEDLVKVGDEIESVVVRVNDAEGVVTLSKKRLDSVKSWETVEEAQENGNVVEGVITEENKGGVVASVKGVRVFIPASQTGLPREAAMTELLKQKVRMKITEVNRARKRVVGSIRAVAQAERAEKAKAVWESIEEGKKYTGVVKSLTSYGAFVDIGGVDGMVHVSELSWSRIKHPSEVVKPGDEVEVYVISFDPEKRKISLGMKDKSQDPWATFTAKYNVGDVAEVKIVKLMTFGAFAEIVPGVDGLIHISQMADHRIDKPSDVVHEGDAVEVKITEIDHDRKKVSLSIRALLEPVAPEGEEEEEAEVEEPAPAEEAAPVEEPAAEPVAEEPAPAEEAAPEAE